MLLKGDFRWDGRVVDAWVTDDVIEHAGCMHAGDDKGGIDCGQSGSHARFRRVRDVRQLSVQRRRWPSRARGRDRNARVR